MSLAEDIPAERPRFESAEAFLDWAEVQPGKWELWDWMARPWGDGPEMMAGGTRAHSQIAVNTVIALGMRLVAGSCRVYNSDFGVVLRPGRVAFPDVSVSCDPEPDDRDRNTPSPVVVIEVLSPSTADYDRGDKAEAYRQVPSLRHLVLVRQDRVGVEHFHREAGDEDFTVTDLDRLDGILRLAAIGVEIALADLYAQVAVKG